MDAVLQNQVIAPKKRYIPKTDKREQSVQLRVCSYLRKHYPNVYFRSDTASGMMLSENQRKLHHSQQSGKGQPDLMIFFPSRGCMGLLLELKDDGTELKMKRNGRKIRVTKIKTKYGFRYEHDYKIRLKGDWASLHIEMQAKVHKDMRDLGYCARFGIGYDHAVQIIDWYMGKPQNAELF